MGNLSRIYKKKIWFILPRFCLLCEILELADFFLQIFQLCFLNFDHLGVRFRLIALKFI